MTELISHITSLEKKNKALKKKVRKESPDLDDGSCEHQVQRKNIKIENEASLEWLSSEESDDEKYEVLYIFKLFHWIMSCNFVILCIIYLVQYDS
jgi:hypothetical protein